jgi:hypothetical protein
MSAPHLIAWEGGTTTECTCPIGDLHPWFDHPYYKTPLQHTHDDDSWWAGCPGCGARTP